MKKRIGLMTTKPHGRSATTFVEVSTAAELKAELAKLGAKRVAQHWRDRFGDGHTEGGVLPLADLSAANLDWVTNPPRGNTRSIFYDTRG